MSPQLMEELAGPQLIVIDPSMIHPMGDEMSSEPIEVSEEPHHEVHEHESGNNENDHYMGHDRHPISTMEVAEPLEVSIVIDELPGAPHGTKDPEPVLEVSDSEKDESHAEDDSDAKSKKNNKWDWSKHGPQGFVAWIKERSEDVPKHSGYDSAGLERACSYLEKLDGEISKAMRLDVDGELDANKIEVVRSQIDDGLSRLQDRLDKVKKTKKKSKKKSDYENSELVKQAQKITGVQGTFVTVPLLISGIARVCINSMVSAGHDLESVYHDQVKKYSLNEREKSEVKWLLFDMGYAMRGDRGFWADDNTTVDPSSSDNFDWAANYRG